MSEELRTKREGDLLADREGETVAVERAVEREVERAVDNRARNEALVSYWVLPFLFLTVAVLGGLRVGADDHPFIFFPPPLITLVLAVLLMLLFVRGGLIELRTWVSGNQPPLANLSH